MRAVLDFETRSACDLKTAGPWKYAADPTTSIICAALGIDGREPLIWWPEWVARILGETPDAGAQEEMDAFLRDPKSELEAHNAEFEQALWTHVRPFGPRLCPPPRRWDCTAARAAVHGLPRNLAQVGQVLGLKQQKDKAGHTLMLKMCKPRRPRKGEDPNVLHWHEEPEDFRRLFEYCQQDVRAEQELGGLVRPLSPFEHKVWELDQTVNARGVAVDLDNIHAIIREVEAVEARLLQEMAELTGGEVNSPRQVAALLAWLEKHDFSMSDLQKETVRDALEKAGLPEEVYRVLRIRQSLGKSSVSKFAAMVDRADADGRCRSLFLYHAAGTGRYGGKAIQPQNLPRDSYDTAVYQLAAEIFHSHGYEGVEVLFGDVFAAASRCIRGSIIAAEGHELVCADYSSIEARANAWIAGELGVLEAFRRGLDLYKVAAVDIFGVEYADVSKAQRQVGKTSELALGYGGGIGAYSTMARGYGVDLEALPAFVFPNATSEERERAEYNAKSYLARAPGAMSFDAAAACDIIKQKWRGKRPAIVRLWSALGTASASAVRDPGNVYSFRGVKFVTWKDRRGNNYLVCQLPSGRCLYYFDPDIRAVKAPWTDHEGKPVYKNLLTFMGVDSMTKQWVRQKGPGFLLCENIVQGLCRDILVEAQLRVEAAGYPVVLHVHDEVVSEIPESWGSLEEFERLMRAAPTWAVGLPIGTEGWRGKRYRKG